MKNVNVIGLLSATIIISGFVWFLVTTTSTQIAISPQPMTPVIYLNTGTTTPNYEETLPSPTAAVAIHPVTHPSTAQAQQLLTLTNKARATSLEYNVKYDIVYDLVLEDLAQQRAVYLCTHDFSHAGSLDFLYQSRYKYVGENLARRFDSTQAMFDAFMASPEHRANILKPEYEFMGVGQACGVTVVFFGGLVY